MPVWLRIFFQVRYSSPRILGFLAVPKSSWLLPSGIGLLTDMEPLAYTHGIKNRTRS